MSSSDIASTVSLPLRMKMNSCLPLCLCGRQRLNILFRKYCALAFQEYILCNENLNQSRLHGMEALIVLANDDEQYANVVLALLDTVDLYHPLATGFIGYFLDFLPNTSQEVLVELTNKVVDKLERCCTKTNPTVRKFQRNAIMTLSILSEKHSGKISEAIITNRVLDIIALYLNCHAFPPLQLTSLMALHSFSISGQLKSRITSRSDLLHIIKEVHMHYSALLPSPGSSCGLQFTPTLSKAPSLTNLWSLMKDRLSTSRVGNRRVVQGVLTDPSQAPNPEEFEIRFASEWALTCIYALSDRKERTLAQSYPQINACLNREDASIGIKMGLSGLEVRNDTSDFETIRATTPVASGIWFYEVFLVTGGIMQIGFATKHLEFSPEQGIGVGDDSNSVAFDGYRRKLWHFNGNWTVGSKTWKAGDTVGCLIDFKNQQFRFYLNGEEQLFEDYNGPTPDFSHYFQTVAISRDSTAAAEARANVESLCSSCSSGTISMEESPAKVNEHIQGSSRSSLPDASEYGVYPALSMMQFQHVILNFGSFAYRYPPPMQFQSFNDHFTLPAHMKSHTPSLSRRQATLQTSLTHEGKSGSGVDDEQCEICYDGKSEVILHPCGHKGICWKCSYLLENCHLCRSKVTLRKAKKDEAVFEGGRLIRTLDTESFLSELGFYSSTKRAREKMD